MAMGDLAREDTYAYGDEPPDGLLRPPRNPAMPPQAAVDLFTPNLSRAETYVPRSSDLQPNEYGKVPTSDPLATGGMADFANMAGYAIPFGGPATKMAVPLLAVGRRLLPAAEEAATKGIRAYHSSPHDFERFDASKIGFGQGAQSYGHGIYFAENPAVSGQGGKYWNEFLSRFVGTPEWEAAKALQRGQFDREAVVGRLRNYVEDLRTVKDPDLLAAETKLKLLESGKPVGPRTYEVNIAARPGQLLDWDKPLAEQGRVGIDAARIAGLSDDVLGAAPGATAYRVAGAPDRTSAALREAGIPGIKYLDEGSRGGRIIGFDPMSKSWRAEVRRGGELVEADFKTEAEARAFVGPQTSNYVMFPGTEDMVRILKKYGVAGAVPTMGALAARDKYGED